MLCLSQYLQYFEKGVQVSKIYPIDKGLQYLKPGACRFLSLVQQCDLILKKVQLNWFQNLLIDRVLPRLDFDVFLAYFCKNNRQIMDKLLERISVDPNICFGKPCIKGTRIWVALILDFLAAGNTFEEILEAYSGISREDILACVGYSVILK